MAQKPSSSKQLVRGKLALPRDIDHRSVAIFNDGDDAGYAASQRARKPIEGVFGWIKSSAGLRQTTHRGRERVGWRFDLAATPTT